MSDWALNTGRCFTTRLIYWILAVLIHLPNTAAGQTLSQKAAVAAAERFVMENGYTSAPTSQTKQQLDLESLEITGDRKRLLQLRHDTLLPKAIGAKPGRRGHNAGWSVAFDFVQRVSGDETSCRVVTMDKDGSHIHLEHVDGIRSYFAGLD